MLSAEMPLPHLVHGLLPTSLTMRSLTLTLLDPFELGEEGSGVRRVTDGADGTQWFNRAEMTFVDLAFVEEVNDPPPWTPEPVDPRWRGRCWGHE